MAQKGIKTTTTPLTISEIETLYNVALYNKWYDLATLIVCGSCYGLHYCDIINLTWSDVLFSDTIFVNSKRNKKIISVTNTKEAKEKMAVIAKLLNIQELSKTVLQSNRYGRTSSTQIINKKLKSLNICSKIHKKTLSTESFRKTFGKKIYDELPDALKMSGLNMLSKYYSHYSIEETKKYLCITDIKMNEFENPTEMFKYIEAMKTIENEAAIDQNFIKQYTKKSYVYLMKDCALPKLVKIGMSDEPTVREGTLQGEKPTIVLFKYLELDCRKDARSFEAMLHDKYSMQRVRGEWFSLSETELSQLLNSYPWIDNTSVYDKRVEEIKRFYNM